MKSVLKVLFVFILAFMFIPAVYAEEIPREGVTYFLEYPNGDEDVFESYNEAVGVNEKLIYEGYTNSNGKISISGVQNWGILRIVQEVPDGYTTNTRELRVNLAEGNTANFVDYRGLSNPSTGRNMLILLGVVVIVGSSILIAKKNKKSLMIIPIALVAFTAYKVSAWSGAFVVTVVDGNGKALNNVRVMVYATPKLEAAPAIKFDANGGNFFDGSTVMYFRIPNDNCTSEEFWNSLTEDEYYYLRDNVDYAYKPGYNMMHPSMPDTLSNGTVIQLQWVQSNGGIKKIDGNGGVMDFHGRQLREVSFNEDNGDIYEYINEFYKDNSYLIGFDTSSSCSNYNQYGIIRNYNVDDDVDTIYLCWNSRPDGIYINNTLFGGTEESCFKESNPEIYDDGVDLFSYGSDSLELYLEDNSVALLFRNNDSGFDPTPPKRISLDGANNASDVITSIVIIKNGQTVLSVSQNELVLNGVYTITNSEKALIFYNYLNELYYNSCRK